MNGGLIYWRKNFLVVCIAICLQTILSGQTEVSNKQFTKDFFEYLISGGGVWKAKNENFNKKEDYGFSHFLLNFELLDSMSLRGEIFGLDIKGDTILFWQVWEFYAPDTNQTIMIQRSPSGLYAIGDAAFAKQGVRTSSFELHFPNKKKLKHKDSHRILSRNEMISESYDYNEVKGQWEDAGKAKWIRQIKT